MSQICKNIKQARINKQLTQEGAATALSGLRGEEIKRATYKNWEDSTEPDLSILQTMAELFEVQLTDLLTGTIEPKTFREGLRDKKTLSKPKQEIEKQEGVPIYDVPIDAGFLERYRDSEYHPLYHLNIPKLRNCNFGAIISGSSMYPIMKSGSIAMCRIVEDLNYIDPGEMYLISTTNGFETVKYVQVGTKKDELMLIPHNEKIKPTAIKKNMIIRICIVEAWINFR